MVQWCCNGHADSAAQFTPEEAAVVLWAATKLGLQAGHYPEAQVTTLNRVSAAPAAVQRLRLHTHCVACGVVPGVQLMQLGRGCPAPACPPGA